MVYADWEDYIWYIAGFILATLVFLFFKQKRRSFKYSQIGSLFTKTELHFYWYLLEAIGNDYVLFGKVRIADLVKPQKGLSKKEWSQNFWRVSSKHIDFVICDKRTLKPVCAIELNDRSHSREDRQKRDADVSRVMRSAGLPLLWIKTSSLYSSADLKNKIAKSIAKCK